MKRLLSLIALILCAAALIVFSGCMVQPTGLRSASSITADADKETDDVSDAAPNTAEEAEKAHELLTLNELIDKLEKGETVYLDEITDSDDEFFAFFNTETKTIAGGYSSYDDLLIDLQQIHLKRASLSRNVPPYNAQAVYVTELDNGKCKYWAVSLCNNRKTFLNADGMPEFIEGTLFHKSQKDDSIRPVVFALIERSGYNDEAKNPASSISDAGTKAVSIKEAFDALNAGQSVRLCDIELPDNAEISACALIVNPQTGEQLKGKNGLIILDGFTGEEFRSSPDGKSLAAEIIVKYKENGYSKKTLLYAYLPPEALDDCLKVNEETMSEDSFVEKYREQASVYIIKNFKENHMVFYDESVINDYINSKLHLSAE